MFEVKYVLSLVIPLSLLVIYAIILQKRTDLAVVSRENYYREKSKSAVNALSQVSSLRTDEIASPYEIFILEKNCTSECQQDVSKALQQRFKCKDISFLEELHYFQAKCDGMRSKSPHQIGEEVVSSVKGVRQHVDDRKLPSSSVGERVASRQFSSTAHKDKTESNGISRIIQIISGTLPWGLDRIDQEKGKDGKLDLSCFPRLGKGVTIYVLDTGCRGTHEDLKERVTLEKVGKYPSGQDDHGHGTHIAGTAAGTNYGVCKSCDIVCVKTLDHNNEGTIVDIVDSIELVLERKMANPEKPAVAVLSLGGSLDTDVLDVAVNKLAKANIFPSVAAGNGFANSCDWTPSRAKHAISVGATMEDDSLRFSSNYGDCVSIVAPGEDIRSPSHLGDSLYVSMSGTSMAAPYVAGVAALMLGEDLSLTPSQILKKMKLNAKIVHDEFHSSQYPLLRILSKDCHRYEFKESGVPNVKGTPEVHGLPSSSPSVSGTPLPSATNSVSPTPSGADITLNAVTSSSSEVQSASGTPSISATAWPSASAAVSASASSTASIPAMASESVTFVSRPPSATFSLPSAPSSSVTPSQSVAALPSSTPWNSVDASPSPTMSSSPLESVTATSSVSPFPSPSPTPSLLLSPSPSASLHPEISRGKEFSSTRPTESPRAEITIAPTVSASKSSQTPNSQSPSPSNLVRSPSPSPFRFFASKINE